MKLTTFATLTVLALLASPAIAGDKDIPIESNSIRIDYTDGMITAGTTLTLLSDTNEWIPYVTDNNILGGYPNYQDEPLPYDGECDSAMFTVIYLCDCEESALRAACFEKQREINVWLKDEKPAYVLGVFKRDTQLTLRKTITELEKLVVEETTKWEIVD